MSRQFTLTVGVELGSWLVAGHCWGKSRAHWQQLDIFPLPLVDNLLIIPDKSVLYLISSVRGAASSSTARESVVWTV